MIFFLFSTVFLFSVIGVAIFGDIDGYGAGTSTEAENFETLPHAIVLMYAMLTTEAYPVLIALPVWWKVSHVWWFLLTTIDIDV